jgi:hypothetical protein
MAKKRKEHTGKQDRGPAMHLKSVQGGNNGDAAHVAANKKHGMGKGCCPDEEYQEGPEGPNEECE